MRAHPEPGLESAAPGERRRAARCSIVGALRQPTLVDFPGRVAVTLFTAGCNFRCGFCHNSSLLSVARPGFTWARLAEICDRHRANWVDGVVLSGGERRCRVHSEGRLALLASAHAKTLPSRPSKDVSFPSLREGVKLLS